MPFYPCLRLVARMKRASLLSPSGPEVGVILFRASSSGVAGAPALPAWFFCIVCRPAYRKRPRRRA